MSPNFVDAYTDWCTAFTHSPGIFHHFIAYWCAAAVLRNRVYMRQGLTSVYPNLWFLIIAKSSWYGKTTALNIGRDMIDDAVPDLFYPDEFSHENLLKNMEKKPQGNFLFSEFRSLMKLLDRDFMSGTKSFLTDLYDCPRERRRTVGVKEEKEFVIKNPVINIAAATTIDWFTDTVKDKDVLSGFIPRFLMIPAPSDHDTFYPRQRTADMAARQKLVGMLKDISACEGETAFTPEASKLYDKLCMSFYDKHRQNGNMCSPFYPRLMSYAVKFSILNSCINGNFPHITEDDVEMAWVKIRQLTMSINEIIEHEVTFSPDQAYRKKAMDLLKHEFPKEVLWSDLLRYTKLKTRDLKDVMESLFESDLIEKREEKAEGGGPGRPKQLFKYIQPKIKLDAEEN